MRALAIAVLLLAAGCRTPVQVPFRFLPPHDPRPRLLVIEWNRGAEERRGMRAVADLAVDAAGGAQRVRSRQVVALERPARLRVEVLGLLNQTAAVIVTDGEQYELFRSADRSYESGEVHPGLLWEQTYLDLTPEEAIELLLGAPFLDPTLAPVRAFEDRAGAIQFDLVDDRGVVRERAQFDAASRLDWLELRGPEGVPEWQVRFGDYRSVGGESVAHEIELDVASGRTHAEISLRDVDLNPALPDDLFRLRLPR